jgi:hypothetical protein
VTLNDSTAPPLAGLSVICRTNFPETYDTWADMVSPAETVMLEMTTELLGYISYQA